MITQLTLHQLTKTIILLLIQQSPSIQRPRTRPRSEVKQRKMPSKPKTLAQQARSQHCEHIAIRNVCGDNHGQSWRAIKIQSPQHQQIRGLWQARGQITTSAIMTCRRQPRQFQDQHLSNRPIESCSQAERRLSTTTVDPCPSPVTI